MKTSQRGFIFPLVIIVVAAIVIGGGAYVYKNKAKTNTQSNATTSVTAAADNSAVGASSTVNASTSVKVNLGQGQKSFKDLLASGSSQVCTFSEKAGNADVQGTVYVAGGKIKGDFNTTASGQIIKSHLIADQTMMYAWVDGLDLGFKASIDAKAQTPEMDVNKKMNIDCKPWTANTSLFTPPASINFNAITGTTVR